MKKIFFLSFTFFLLFHISALGFGINNSVNIIKLEENEYLPDYLIAPETSFFISEDYFINSLFLSSKPSLCISDEKISFRFYEIKLKFRIFFHFFILDKIAVFSPFCIICKSFEY